VDIFGDAAGILMMEALSSSETLVNNSQTTQNNNPLWVLPQISPILNLFLFYTLILCSQQVVLLQK
jgi:hypothetical protein